MKIRCKRSFYSSSKGEDGTIMLKVKKYKKYELIIGRKDRTITIKSKNVYLQMNGQGWKTIEGFFKISKKDKQTIETLIFSPFRALGD